MALRSPPPSKWGRREDDDVESLRRKKLEKGKEPAAKDTDEEPLFDELARPSTSSRIMMCTRTRA
jgi:hypothetical protein